MQVSTIMDLQINNKLDSTTDYRLLDLSPAQAEWPRDPSRSRVLLIAFNVPGYYSLAVRILSLTAALCDATRNRADVRYLELDLDQDRTALLERLSAWAPDIIGLSTNIWNLTPVLRLVTDIKQRSPQITTLLGGQEVTNSVTDFLSENHGIDYIVDGEGELPFLQFLENWSPAERRLTEPSRISGLRYRSNGTVACTGPAAVVPTLDDLPSPILAGLVPAGKKYKLGIMLEGARGCPFQCSFCFEGSRVTKVRMASIERLSEEARSMAAQGASYFHLLDPILCNSRPERLKALSDLFRDLNRQRKMLISLETYAQHINDAIAPYLSEFTSIDVGLQSINLETQREIRRQFSSERFLAGLESLRKTNRRFNLYLICGLPHETTVSFLEGIRFVIGQRPVQIFLNELCLLNGTELRRRAADYGYVFDPLPPYRVRATAWMDRRDLLMTNVLSKVVERRYNLSLDCLFPLAPWTRQGSLQRAVIRLSHQSSCGRSCPGCQAGAGSAPPVGGRPPSLDAAAAGADVHIQGGDAIGDPAYRKLYGDLMLMGASRIRLSAPLEAFPDVTEVQKLLSLGLLHFKTCYAGETDRLPAHKALENLGNLCRTFSMHGYASLRPFTEVVALHAGGSPRAYIEKVNRIASFAPDLITVPAPPGGEDDTWMNELVASFWDLQQRGLWLALPRAAAEFALRQHRERARLVPLLEELGLLSTATRFPPCFAPADPPGEPG